MHAKSTLESKIAAIEQDYPFPEPERLRTDRRRWILRYGRLKGVGAEIGVFRGHFSEVLLRTLTPRVFYLVDPWSMAYETYPDWGPYTNHGTLPTAVARDEALLRVSRYEQTSCIPLEDKFPACRHRIADQLDWVYLDASHRYEDTLEELHALDALLSPRGVVFGDDWHPDPRHRHHGVFRAVNDFVATNEYEFVAAGPALQWCIRRPATGQASNVRPVAL